MPLPIAHSAAGLAGYVAFKKANPDSPPKQEIFVLGLCLFLANLPDLDFIPGFLCGDPGRFHHGPSHSFVVGLVGVLIFYRFACYWLTGISKKRLFGCCFVSLLSHPILDYFSADTSKPFGVPLFWPFDTEYQTKSLWADGHFPVFFTGHFAKIDTDFLRIKRCCDYSTTEPYFYLFLLRIKAF